MKKGKSLIILSALLVVIIAAIFIVKGIKEKQEELSKIDEVISSVDKDDIIEIDWADATASLSFTYDGEVWTCEEDPDMPVSEEAIEVVLNHLTSINACFIIENVEDYDQYGLVDNATKIHYTTEDGDETTIELGAYSTIDSIRYISIGDGNVYMIEDDLTTVYSTTQSAYLEIETHPTVSTITNIAISGEKNFEVELDEERAGYIYGISWWLSLTDSNNELDQYIPAVQYSISSLAKSLSTYTETSPVSYTASKDDLSTYGLDDPLYTVTISGITSDEDASFTYDVGVVDDSAYLRVRDSEFIFSATSLLSTIQDADPIELTYNRVVTIPEWEKANSISFIFEDTDYTFDFNWQLPLDESGNEVESDLVCNAREGEINLDNLMTHFDAMVLSSYAHPEVSGVLEFAATLNITNDYIDTFNIEFYRYDSSECLVVVNGNSVGYMSRDYLVNFKEACTRIAIESTK